MKKNPLDTNSPAKRKCIEFMRAEDNVEFTFTLDGQDENAARKFVQHMRVELNRFRTMLREAGHVPKSISMRVRDYLVTEEGVTVVMFKQAADETVAVDIAALFPELVSSFTPAPERHKETDDT